MSQFLSMGRAALLIDAILCLSIPDRQPSSPCVKSLPARKISPTECKSNKVADNQVSILETWKTSMNLLLQSMELPVQLLDLGNSLLIDKHEPHSHFHNLKH